MSSLRRLSCAVFLALAASFTTTVVAEQQVMLVLDASGSMWGRIDGKPKIEIARGVVADVLEDWNPDNHIGLIAYGHRSKGDCNDIETLVPVGRLDADAFNGIVRAINPKGKTPISAAVTQAAETLKYTEEKATVILVSDGKETCNADPCKTAAALELNGVDFTAHVIGFDVADKDGLSQLQCLARDTGGSFVTARNAEDLKSALATAVKTVEAAQSDPNAPGNLRLTTVLQAGGEPLSVDDCTIFREQADDFGKLQRMQVERRVLHATEHLFKLPPGEYIAACGYGNASAEARITIEPAKAVARELVLGAGKLRMYAVMVAGGDKVNTDDFRVYREVSDDFGKPNRELAARHVLHHTQYTFTLPAGDYIAAMSHGAAAAEQRVTVEAGKGVEAEINFNAGQLRISPVDAPGGNPLNIDDYRIYREVADKFGKPARELVSRYVLHATRRTFTLSAGDYIAAVSHRGLNAEQAVTVTGGKGIDVELVLAAKHYPDLSGDWNTSEGRMQLAPAAGGKVNGSYTTDNGRVFFKRDGQKLSGYWVEDKSSTKCSAERDGSVYWGRLEIEVNPKNNRFEGWWSYCDSTTHAGGWSGHRD